MAPVESEPFGSALPMNQQDFAMQEIRRDTAMQIISQIFNAQVIALSDSKITDAICERHCLHRYTSLVQLFQQTGNNTV